NSLPPYDLAMINPTNYDDTNPAHDTQRIMTSQWLTKASQPGFMDPSYMYYNEVSQTLHGPWAGILTAPDFAIKHYSAGTNRRPIKFLMQNFLCRSLEQLMDTSLPDTWVRRDVDRSPGGDSRTYKQQCIACHSGIDAITGAFAYYDINVTIGHILDKR